MEKPCKSTRTNMVGGDGMNLLKALDYKKMSKDRIEAIANGILDGGEGSGNFGHAGRPGQVGGSGGGGGGGKKANSGTKGEHQKAVDILKNKDYDDGTYSVSSLKPVEFDHGYQVTFCQIGDDYSDEEYAEKVNEFYNLSSDRESYAGKFEGEPEISFHFDNLDDAVRMGKKYNQISIWDWGNMNEIKTGGTGGRG